MIDDSVMESGIAEFLRRFLEASGLDIAVNITLRAEPRPLLIVRFRGPDILILQADEGSVLEALKHLTGEIFGFPVSGTELMSFSVAEAEQAELPGEAF